MDIAFSDPLREYGPELEEEDGPAFKYGCETCA